MFRKTRLRLVLLNSMVFFIVLLAFGGILYAYTEHRLYSQADHELEDAARHLQHENFHDLREAHDADLSGDVHIIYLLRGADGSVVRQEPGHPILTDRIPPANVGLSHNGQTWGTDDHVYRVVTIPVPKGQSDIIPGTPVHEVQLLYNLEAERKVLFSLQVVIELGIAVGAVAAMLAGLYLANRALIPIQRSWNKQQQFVADASHELRTPLSVMQVNLERLFRHPANTVEQESEVISALMQEVGAMRKLVADLLTLAGSDSNQSQIIKQPFDLERTVTEMVDSFRYLAESKDVRIHLKCDASIPMHGDQERIRQLMGILLDNALKYTPENGEIQVRCHRHGSSVLLDVADTGIGIAPEDLPHVFDRFYRADKSRSRAVEGTGLGLSIAQWIVSEHAGKIRVTSAPGNGTTVHVQLPVKA